MGSPAYFVALSAARAASTDGFGRGLGSRLAVIGGAAGEECCARRGVFGIEAQPVHHLALIDQLPQHAPDRRIVERLLRGVEAIGAGKHVAAGEVDDLHLGVLFENRQQIERRVLHEIHFAGLQRGCRRRTIGNDANFQRVDVDALAAGQEVGGLGTRHIIGEFLQDHAIAGTVIGLAVDERTGAYDFGDALIGRRLGHALGHHESDGADGIAERVDHQARGLFQRQHERLGIAGFERRSDREDSPAERVALSPASQRRDAIRRRDRLAVMPFQAVAQCERVDQAIRRYLPVLHHLRLDFTLGVLCEQGVEHHEAEGPRDIGRREMRIERGDFRFQHRDEIAAGIGRRNRRSRDERERKRR